MTSIVITANAGGVAAIQEIADDGSDLGLPTSATLDGAGVATVSLSPSAAGNEYQITVDGYLMHCIVVPASGTYDWDDPAIACTDSLDVAAPSTGSLLDDPPFVMVRDTRGVVFTGGNNQLLIWDTVREHGTSFTSVGGTDVTTSVDCTIIISTEYLFTASTGPCNGMSAFSLGGSVFSAAYLDTSVDWTAYGNYSIPYNFTAGNFFLTGIFTTPPFRVTAGTTIQLYEQLYPNVGSVTDGGSGLIITQVA